MAIKEMKPVPNGSMGAAIEMEVRVTETQAQSFIGELVDVFGREEVERMLREEAS